MDSTRDSNRAAADINMYPHTADPIFPMHALVGSCAVAKRALRVTVGTFVFIRFDDVPKNKHRAGKLDRIASLFCEKGSSYLQYNVL
eukprot:scaffold364113_cov55-Attheya_sp.AAC.1